MLFRKLFGRRTEPSTERLPPGQKWVKGWPVLHEGPVPTFDPQKWRLRIWGEVEQEVELSWAQLNAMPRLELTRDWHCVTTWSKMDNRWGGIDVDAVLALARPKPSATHVMLHAYDSIAYTTNLAMSDFAGRQNLLATHHDGQAITPEHGGPVRVIVHHLYAWKSAKWVCGIELMSADKRGFWEERGYHNRADPFLEERYSWQE